MLHCDYSFEHLDIILFSEQQANKYLIGFVFPEESISLPELVLQSLDLFFERHHDGLQQLGVLVRALHRVLVRGRMVNRAGGLEQTRPNNLRGQQTFNILRLMSP